MGVEAGLGGCTTSPAGALPSCLGGSGDPPHVLPAGAGGGGGKGPGPSAAPQAPLAHEETVTDPRHTRAARGVPCGGRPCDTVGGLSPRSRARRVLSFVYFSSINSRNTPGGRGRSCSDRIREPRDPCRTSDPTAGRGVETGSRPVLEAPVSPVLLVPATRWADT